MATGGEEGMGEVSSDPLRGFEYFCQPCSKLEPPEHLEAEGYCKDCSEFLCSRCFQVHKIPSALRHHVLLNKTDMRRLDPPPPEGTCTDRCPQHQEHVQFFCPRHSALACKTCRATDHKLCSNVVRIRISPDLVNTSEYKTLGETVDKMESKLQGAQIMLQGKKRTADATFSKVQESIKTFKEEVVSLLNNMERDLVEAANRLRREEKDCVERKIESLAEMLQEVQSVRTELQNLATDQQFSLLFLAMKKGPARLTAVQSGLDDLDPEAHTTPYSFLPNLQVIDILGSPTGLGTVECSKDSPGVQEEHSNSLASPAGVSQPTQTTDVTDAQEISNLQSDNQGSPVKQQKAIPATGNPKSGGKQLKIFGLPEEPNDVSENAEACDQLAESAEACDELSDSAEEECDEHDDSADEECDQLADRAEACEEQLNMSSSVLGLETLPPQSTTDHDHDQYEDQFTSSSHHPSLAQQSSMDSDPSCDSLPDVTDDELDAEDQEDLHLFAASDEVSGELDATPLDDIYVDSRHSSRPCWITGVTIVGNKLVITDHNNCKVNFVELGDDSSNSARHSPNVGSTSNRHSNVGLTLGQSGANGNSNMGENEVREMRLAKAPWDVVEIEEQEELGSPRGGTLPRPDSQDLHQHDPISHDDKNKDYRYRDSRRLAYARKGQGQTTAGNCKSNTIYHDSNRSGWISSTNQRVSKSADGDNATSSSRPTSLFSFSGRYGASSLEGSEHEGSLQCVAVTVPEKHKIVVLRLGRRITKVRKIRVSGECYGIAFHQAKLIVSYKNPGKLEIMDTSGRVHKKIEQDRAGRDLFSFPAYIALSPDGGMIYVSDKVKNSVTSVYIHGRMNKVFTDPCLQCPSKLAVDSNDNIFVGGRDSKNVVVLDSDMSRAQVMMSTLMSPHALCYKSETARLYLGLFGNNTISVYQVS